MSKRITTTLALLFLAVGPHAAATDPAQESQPDCADATTFRSTDFRTVIEEAGVSALPAPDVPPRFGDDEADLQGFFDTHIDLSEDTADFFGFVHLAVLVDCRGAVEEVRIPKGQAFAKIARRLKPVAAAMTEWTPARHGTPASPVNCWTILRFHINQGKVDVSIR